MTILSACSTSSRSQKWDSNQLLEFFFVYIFTYNDFKVKDSYIMTLFTPLMIFFFYKNHSIFFIGKKGFLRSETEYFYGIFAYCES